MAEPETAPPDAALMEAFQRGDEAAFGTLVDRHREKVFRLACRYLGDATAADDLAQETFLRVYRSRHTWRPEAKFSTWLYRVTVNACLNELRSRRVRRAVETTSAAAPGAGAGTDPGGPALDGPDPRAADPGDAALRGELAEVVWKAVQGLPEDQRMAVLLSKYEGLSYRELADAMDRSIPAVKSLLVRARDHLRTSLAPYLDRAPDAPEEDEMLPAERRKRERREARRATDRTAAGGSAAGGTSEGTR
jgi:RNA polymerase sigma-70 factor (ECF subfamily)